jgi:hypothetical protein
MISLSRLYASCAYGFMNEGAGQHDEDDDVEPDYMKDDQRPIVGGESAPGGIKTPGVMTTAKDGRKKVTIKKSNKDKKNAAENLLDTLASFAKTVAGSQTADKEKKEK